MAPGDGSPAQVVAKPATTASGRWIAIRMAAIPVWLASLALFVIALIRGEELIVLYVIPGYGTIGMLIAYRRPSNPLGWVLLVTALVAGISLQSDIKYVLGWSVVSAGVASLMALFPTGRIIGRIWWLPLLLVGLGWSIVVAFPELGGEVRSGFGVLLGVPIVLLGLGWCAAAPFVRYRRATGIERRQLAWLGWTALATVLISVLAAGLRVLGAPSRLFNSVALSGVLLALLGIPASIGIAVFRYRLYDIDRIVSRTVSYGMVAAALAAVYAAVAIGLPSVLGLASSSPLLVAAATLAAAALFNPLRRRIQASVDRRFNRSRYDAQRVMNEFAGSLQDRVDPAGVVDGWVEVVAETMQPSSVSVWVRES